MIDDLPAGFGARRLDEEDHLPVLAVLDSWWGGLKGPAGAKERALLLPRLYFQHFTSTSFVVERDNGEMAAFLIGFLSQTEPEAAYVHFVGVDPALHGRASDVRCTGRSSRSSGNTGAVTSPASPARRTRRRRHSTRGSASRPPR